MIRPVARCPDTERRWNPDRPTAIICHNDQGQRDSVRENDLSCITSRLSPEEISDLMARAGGRLNCAKCASTWCTSWPSGIRGYSSSVRIWESAPEPVKDEMPTVFHGGREPKPTSWHGRRTGPRRKRSSYVNTIANIPDAAVFRSDSFSIYACMTSACG